ncbi:MAG: protein kinase [Actinomycetota bacterium]
MSAEAGPGIDGLSGFRRIGSGGFSTVYAAWEDDFSRWVAVKVLHDLDTGAVRRFERERSLMGQSSGHPNVTTPMRAGITADGNPYLVMQYMEGGSLQDLVDSGRLMPWREAVSLVRPIADALGSSHEQGIVHKDVKPANILLARNGAPTLTDFGIAGLRGSTSTRMAYTFSHSPPETFGGGVDLRDERSDLYSLASTLYTVIAGRSPFESDADDSELAWLTRIATHPAPALGVDPHLDRFFEVALAKDPDHRPQDATAFIDGLDRVLAGRLVAPETVLAPDAGSAPAAGLTSVAPEASRAPATVVSMPADVGAPAGPQPHPGTGPDGRSSALGWLVAGVAVIALLGAAWFAFLRDTDGVAGTASTPEETTGGDVAGPSTDEPDDGPTDETADDAGGPTTSVAAEQIQQASTLLQDPESKVSALLSGQGLPTTSVTDSGFTFNNCEIQLVALQTAYGGAGLPQLRDEIALWPTGAPEGYVDPAAQDRGFRERLEAYVRQLEIGYQTCVDEAEIRPVGTHVLSGFASLRTFFCATGVVTEVELADGSSEPCPTADEQQLCTKILNPLLSDFFMAFPVLQPDATPACQAAIADDDTLFAQV